MSLSPQRSRQKSTTSCLMSAGYSCSSSPTARVYTAHRVRAVVGRVFRYTIATGRASRDISADLKGTLTPKDPKHRPGITEPSKVGALLRAIDGYDGQPATLAVLRIAPYVFVRPVELRTAEWSHFDLDKAEWRIPAEIMKLRDITSCRCRLKRWRY